MCSFTFHRASGFVTTVHSFWANGAVNDARTTSWKTVRLDFFIQRLPCRSFVFTANERPRSEIRVDVYSSGQDRFRIALKRLWALLGRPRIDVCVEDGGLDVGFADVRYFGTTLPLFLFLSLSFLYFRCVLVLLKLASHASCSSTGSNFDSHPTAAFPVPIRRSNLDYFPIADHSETGRPARRWRNIAIALIDGKICLRHCRRTNPVKPSDHRFWPVPHTDSGQ
jgi:hypothetical protein